jgi:Bacterial DNA polymerase III alpha subunit finger domain
MRQVALGLSHRPRRLWAALPLVARDWTEDPETYAMIRKADTIGTFQIESRAQMSMLPRLRPSGYRDQP